MINDTRFIYFFVLFCFWSFVFSIKDDQISQSDKHDHILFQIITLLPDNGKLDIAMFLTLVLLNPDIPVIANSVEPDQLASEEANWSGSALFAIKYVNL